MKLTFEDKVRLYFDRKNGYTIKALSSKYNITKHNVKYLIRLVDKHGFEVLRKNSNNYYSVAFKENAINRVLLAKESSLSVSIDLGLRHGGILNSWIQKYKENGYNVVERKRGRPSMTKKPIKPNKLETEKEELERLRKEVEYLKAELEYSKKLEAVVLQRKNRQQKKK